MRTYLVEDLLNFMIYEMACTFRLARCWMMCLCFTCVYYVHFGLKSNQNENTTNDKKKQRNTNFNRQWMIVKWHAAAGATAKWIFRFNSFWIFFVLLCFVGHFSFWFRAIPELSVEFFNSKKIVFLIASR